jgi:hypothetical protein
MTWDILSENQISANYRYIEIICEKPRLSKPVIHHKISQITPNYRYVDDLPEFKAQRIIFFLVVAQPSN